ncbi:XdhC family protein [Streptomyces sp. NPDC056738]|uniref:XdhC family protein n=1 Tax=Streptomyces sp. NPDC056738 TaxID=3345933 RepID=UPI0036CF3BAB
MAESVAAGRPVTLATVLDGPAPRGATLAVRPEEPVPVGPTPSGAPQGTPGPKPSTAPDGPPAATGPAGTPGSAGPDGDAAARADSTGPGRTPGPAGPDGAASAPAGSTGVDRAPGPAGPHGAFSAPPGRADPHRTSGASGPDHTPDSAGPDAAVSVPPGPVDPVVEVVGSLGAEGLDVAVVADAWGELAQGATGCRHYGPHGERREDAVTVFLHSFAPPPRMLVFGAIDYASAVARIGSFLGYRVTVCDARPVFATAERFPAAVEVVVDWPHHYLSATTTDERTVICVLTHDPKFDVPLLEEALRRPAAYIGAMGSRRTHDDRLERLRAAGVPEQELSRLHSPVGLDLGARTPEEVAVSVAAEIIASRWGGSGLPLTVRGGAIHPR